MRKKIFTFLLALVTSVGLSWAEPVTVVFEANNNQKEVEVTLPHTFACDFQNGNGELDGIIQELYALQYGGYCQAFTVPTATGNAAVTASKDGNNHYIAISEAFEGTATVTGNYIKYLDTEQMGNTSVDYTLTISVQGSTPTPTPSATSGIFAYNYDCSRWPAYPTKNNSCQLSGFNAPCVGLNGIDCYIGNVSQGPWKVEFYEMYDDDHVSTYGSIYGVRADAYGILTEYYGSSAVPEYYTDQSAFAAYAHEKLPVYSLSQWNGNAYQVVGYGFICAYAGEGNVVEHAALFIEAGNDYGCFLSGHEHSGSLELTFDYDLKDDMTSFFADGGGSANPVIKLNANFGGTYDWADTEAFTDNGDGTATLSNIALELGYYYNFRVKVDGVSISDNHEFTRQNPSYVISSGSGDVYYFQADVTGNYSFTWEYATNTLTIGYPASTPAVDPAVQNVIDLINAIPNPVVYNQECFNALNAVYDAYVALSEEQRDQVTNYDDYLAAESRYYMLADVNHVIETINEIGNVEFTSACKHRIDYARSEYCYLTLEQKGYVTNYNTLLAAEAAYAALIPVSSTVVWDEAILETIDVDEWNVTTYTNGSLSLKAVDGRAYYVDGEQHFLFDGSNSEQSFVFSCTSANLLRIEITVSEKHEHNELSCAWQETATGYRWVGEATSVDLASGISKVTEIRFSLGEAFPEPTPTPAQEGDKLPGAFSVGGETIVYFSKGNLQYLGNIDRWHFAENQWTIIGNAQASNNRDLFSWGTGDNPDSEDYSTYTEWGNNIEGNWRTLTVEEWDYLFNTRTGASSKYGTATVAGVVGLILLPDVYDGTAINTERTAWDNNVISSSEWAAYEAAGAVFLPAAGLSEAYGVSGVGEQGFYWSSTMDALSYNAISIFYGFNYWEGYWFNQVDAQFQPQEGHSVRLVSETAPSGGSTPAVTNYSISLDGITENADKVTLNNASAAEGETITLTPAAGYQITAFTASYASAYSVRVTADPNVNVYDATPYVGALPKEFTENVTPGLNGATFHSIEGDDPFTPVPASVLEYVGMNAAKDQMTIRVNDAFSGIIRVNYTYNVETCEWDEYEQQEICMGGTAQASVRVVCEAAGGVAPASKDDVTGAYSFTMPAGNVTITATVEAIPAPAPTAAVIGDPNNASEVETFLTTYDGQTIDELIIDRPVLNNMYNTLCLPFDMNATQIAASSLNGVEIREFTGASVEGTTLNLSVGDPVNAVVAGRPYFVKFSAASQLDDLHFEDVTINNALLDNMAVTFDGVTFKGTFTPFVMPNGLNFQGGYLFLGQNNQLFWPNTSNPLKPFRAYFYVDVESSTPGNAPKYRGMPARIVEGKNVTTGVENAQSANQSTKVIVNGQLIIIKNDVHYNAQGQIVK